MQGDSSGRDPEAATPGGNSLEADLARRLSTIRSQNLHRELSEVGTAQGARVTFRGMPLLNFSSNDYLSLANHPSLKAAATKAIEEFGCGSGASRLVCGSLTPHCVLESKLAELKGQQAALSFSSGYAAATGTIPTLVGRGDIVILDKLVHACIVDATRSSGATIRVFHHNDPDDLESILRWADGQRSSSDKKRILIVTESVFSMDGDQAPLKQVAEMKEKYGAWLMVDEAHATGLFGNNGSGLAEELGVSGQIEIHMGTLGKAIGSAGGYIAGSRSLVDFLVNRARSFIFSTAPTPAAAACATAGVDLIQSEEGRSRRVAVWDRVRQLLSALGQKGDKASSAIIPLVVGAESVAVNASRQLRDRGFLVPAIRYPTVGRNKARLRITLCADHQPGDITSLVSALSELALVSPGESGRS